MLDAVLRLSGDQEIRVQDNRNQDIRIIVDQGIGLTELHLLTGIVGLGILLF